jgi:putative acetyltransferase
MKIRQIRQSDNPYIYDIVKTAMLSFGADPKKTVLRDESLQKMSEHYGGEREIYFVAEDDNGEVLGGAGIKQLQGGNEDVCELQRMFLSPQAHGKGIGQKLMDLCIEKAKEFGYKIIYLESLTAMTKARKLYDRSGFRLIDHPMGDTGHGGCNVWMIREV